MRQATLMVATGVLVAGLSTVLAVGADALPFTDEASETVHVTIQNFEFEDNRTDTPVTTIEAGDTVTWTWIEGCHSVTQGVRGPYNNPVGPSAFDSDVRCASFDENGTPLTTFSITFEEPGVFKYFCQPHPNMEGVVVVQPR